MRKLFIGPIVLLEAMIVFSPSLSAQSPGKGTAVQSIPDLSGIWDGAVGPARRDSRSLCAEPGCRAVFGLGPLPRVARNIEEPQMLPWAEELYKSVREGITDPNANAHQELNPAWGGCMPVGPAQVVGAGFELRQFPDAVYLLYGADHTIRRIFLNGSHPADLQLTWMGHSIGKYEGDALVVDTVGINPKTWIDAQGHPHTEALRMTERYRRVDKETLEMVFTFDDPKTYVKPWSRQVTHTLRPPGIDFWNGVDCDELLQLGTHYSAESKK